MAFNRKDIDAAAKGDQDALRRVLDRMSQWQGKLESVMGINPDSVNDSTLPSTFAPPPPAHLDVSTQSGAFYLQITNDKSVKVPLLIHQIQSSPTLPFESSTTVVDYGASTQLALTVVQPNATLYWRIRSRYPMGDWNGWHVYQGSSGGNPAVPGSSTSSSTGATSTTSGSGGGGGGTGTAVLLPNQTRQRQMPVIGTPDAAAAPSSTDTVNMKVTMGVAKNWVTGTRVTVNASGNGLVTGTEYYLNRFSSTIFAFYLTVDNAVNDTSRVALTGSVTAIITPDAVVFCTIPATAVPAALATLRSLSTGGNWLVRFGGVAPTTTVYSVKVGAGDSTLGTLGEGFSETEPPVGDICVLHDDPSNVGAGVLECYAAWNDNTSPTAGATGPAGATGRGYKASSVSSLTIAASGSVTFVTQTNLAYTVGARIRATSTGSAAFMEGVVTAYTEFATTANLVVTLDLSSGAGTHTDWDLNLSGVQGTNGTSGVNGSTWFEGGGAPSGGTGINGDFYLDTSGAGLGIIPYPINNFRLTLASGLPVYRPSTLTPSATDTAAETVTFAAAHGWVTGTIVTISATVGGLTAGIRYYVRALSSTQVAFYTTLANALVDSSRVDLTASVTNSLIPSGVTGTTIYLSPYDGNLIGLYSGGWSLHPTAEISLALGTLTSGLNYDVFAVWNGSIVVLELLAWSGDTARATALTTQDGVLVKTGDSTRRYIGTLRTDSTTTTIDDGGGIASQTGGKRFLWNFAHRVLSDLCVIDTTASWTYNSLTPHQANAAAGNKVEVVIGVALDIIEAEAVSFISQSATTGAVTAPGIDSTTVFAPRSIRNQLSSFAGNGIVFGKWRGWAIAGYHAINWLEAAVNTNAVTIQGTNGGFQSGMTVMVRG